MEFEFHIIDFRPKVQFDFPSDPLVSIKSSTYSVTQNLISKYQSFNITNTHILFTDLPFLIDQIEKRFHSIVFKVIPKKSHSFQHFVDLQRLSELHQSLIVYLISIQIQKHQ